MSEQQPPVDGPDAPAAPEPTPSAEAPAAPAPMPPAAPPPPGYAPPPAWPPPGAAAPPPPGPPPAAYPPPGAYPPAQPYAYIPPAPPTSTMAIVGLVLAILSWVLCPVIPAIVALVLARQSGQEIARSNGTIGGAGLNTGTRIVSWINIGVYGAIIIGAGLFVLIAAIIAAANPS